MSKKPLPGKPSAKKLSNSYFDRECAQRLFAALYAHWRESPGYTGMYRPGYSQQETAAIGMVLQEAHRIGMPSYADLAGNVYMRFAGSNPRAKAIVTGSHLDAVPQGGQFDGPAGVIGPLAMCSAFKKAGVTPPQDIIVMITRAEESPWYAQSSIGSKLAVGNFPVEKMASLTHREDGRTLAQHMEHCGVDARKLQACGVLLPTGQIAAFIELHIEQGPLLHQQGVPVGVVTSNRGSIRIPSVRFEGEGGHTGTTPMELRRDAVRAAARFITRFEDGCNALIAQGHDVVFTIPVIGQAPGASPTTIPSECHFTLEARSDSIPTQTLILALIGKVQYAVEQEYGVTVTLAKPVVSRPARMDADMQARLAAAAGKQQVAHQAIAGGAGHDAAIFANAGIKTGMLFIRHEGRSHRHDEGMAVDDMAAAVQVLAQLCLEGVDAGAITDQSFLDVLMARAAEPIMMQDYAAVAAR